MTPKEGKACSKVLSQPERSLVNKWNKPYNRNGLYVPYKKIQAGFSKKKYVPFKNICFSSNELPDNL